VLILALALWSLALAQSFGQAVGVTMRLDTNSIVVSGSTTLHIYAQVAPAFRSNAERIFSWYVDVLNTNGAVASASYAAMEKTASDKDVSTSSTGSSEGANRRGIYDTFLNLPGAGVAAPVELMAIPVTGLVSGKARFQVRAGSGVPELSDFLVVPITGVDPFTGGNYSAANIDLTVVEGCGVRLQVVPGNFGPGQRLQLSFIPCPGFNHTVEYRDTLNDPLGWRALPGAPHNSGNVSVTNIGPQRFFRVSSVAIPSFTDLRLNIAPLAGGASQRFTLTFPTVTGYNYTVEFVNALLSSNSWQSLPGAPHNSGSVTVTNAQPQRFYRLRVNPL